jgi:hypothetical protein
MGKSTISMVIFNGKAYFLFDSDFLNEPHASQEDVKPCSFAPEHDIATTTPKTPQDTDENSTDGPAKSCATRMVESQRKSWDVYPLVN